MRKKIKKKVFWIIKLVAGIFLIIVGIVGIFLPILPGIILIIAGLVLLENKKIKEWIVKIADKVKQILL